MSTLTGRVHAGKIYKMLLVRYIRIPVRSILYRIWNGKRRKLHTIREFPPNLYTTSLRYVSNGMSSSLNSTVCANGSSIFRSRRIFCSVVE